jgi:tetratricopeptide (TPR) repeat protein
VVIEGSVRRQGERLRVVARLAKVSDGASLWSQTYERKMRDVFAIQDEIAQSVANALRVQVRGGAARATQARTTQNLEAYNLYLRGRQQTNMHSEEGMKRSIAYYEEALRLDPDYAPALAALSMGYSLAGYYQLAPEGEVWGKARTAAEQAIARDPTLADAHTSLGLSLSFHDWKWREAETAFRKAIEVDDSSALAHGLYATALLLPERRLEETEREFRKALDLDPVLSFVNFTYGFALLAGERYEEAVGQYRRALELKGLHPDVYWDYGMALGLAGRHAEAREAMVRARKERGQRSLDLRGLEALFAGDKEKARADAPGTEKAAAEGREDYMDAARTWAMLGEKEKALNCLEISIDRREPQAVWVKSDPRLKALFSDPRHTELVKKVGL